MSSIPRILVFRIGAFGDTLVSIPALYAIRQYFGKAAKIFLLRNSECKGLVVPDDLLSPHSCVDAFINYPSAGGRLSRTASIVRLVLTLRKLKFDAVVYLVPAQREKFAVARDKFFFRVSGMKRFIGFHSFTKHELFPHGLDGKPSAVKSEALFLLDRLEIEGIHVTESLDLISRGLELTESERGNAVKWLCSKGWNQNDILISIAPGSKHPINRWPLERFVEAGQRLKRLLGCQIVVVGGTGEHEAGQKLINKWGHGINAAGIFSPRGTAAILERCKVLIGLDTGTTHLAAAVGVTCVGIYSAKDNPGRWHPLGNGHQILRKDGEVSCAGCMLPDCPFPACKCMELITVKEVVEACAKICRLGQSQTAATTCDGQDGQDREN